MKEPTINAREVFRRNLNRYMEIRRIDQAEIVLRLGTTASTVSDWVNGKKYPRVDAMQRLADLLDVAMSDLTAEQAPANKDGRSKEKQEFVELIDSLPDDVVARLLQIAQSVVDLREK